MPDISFDDIDTTPKASPPSGGSISFDDIDTGGSKPQQPTPFWSWDRLKRRCNRLRREIEGYETYPKPGNDKNC